MGGLVWGFVWLVWVVLVCFGVVVYFGLVLCVAMVRIFCSLDCSVYFWLCASDVGFAARVGGGFCVIVVGGFLVGSCFVGVGVFGSGVWFWRWVLVFCCFIDGFGFVLNLLFVVCVILSGILFGWVGGRQFWPVGWVACGW